MNRAKVLPLIGTMIVMAACAPMMKSIITPTATLTRIQQIKATSLVSREILDRATPTATPSVAKAPTRIGRCPGMTYYQQLQAEKEFSDGYCPTPKATRRATDRHNPTFAEMIAFLNKSTVNWNEYVSSRRGRYVCIDFACDLQDEAAGLGIRSAVVIIAFPPGSGSHGLIAFETTDKGLIYFEPQVDHRMKVEVGRKYWSWIYWPDYDYHIDYDDTVMSIQLLWNPTSLYCP